MRKTPSPAARFVLLAVLWLAAALRWTAPGLIEFKYDEARTFSMARAIADGGYFPLVSGGTSLGVQRSAFDAYLLALPLTVAGERPEAAVWMVGALGVAAVAVTYTLGRTIGGRRVGLMAAAAVACNPWMAYYDRKLWAHIQIFFSALLVWLAWQLIVRRRAVAALLFPVVAAAQVLSHLLALVQAVSYAAAVAVAPGRWWRRATGVGGLLALAAMWPYLRRVLSDVVSGRSALVDGAASAWGLGRGEWLSLLRLLSGSGLSSLAGKESTTSVIWAVSDWLAWPIATLVVAGFVRVCWRASRPGHIGDRLLLAWTVAPVILLSLGVLPVYPQYWTILWPLPAIFLALGIDALVSMGLPRWGGLALAALIVGVWVAAFALTLRSVDSGWGGRTFGIPLERWQETMQATRQWAARLGTQEVRVAVQGVDPGYESDPAVVATLIGNPPWARFVAPQTPPALLLSYDRPSLYLWMISAPNAERVLAEWGDLVWEAQLMRELPPARLYRLPAARELALPVVWLDEPIVFDAGMALMGYHIPQDAIAGEPLRVTLVWRVLDPPPEVRQRDMTAFNHILNETGAMAAQVDGLALLSRDWWPGDVLIQPYLIQLPAGTYRWRVGLYSRVDGGRAQRLDGGGDAVDLGPWTVTPRTAP